MPTKVFTPLLFCCLFCSFARMGQSIKICLGTDNVLSRPANLNTHYVNFIARYSGCTHVEGNLEITHFELNSNLSAIEDIQEVSGYLFISLLRTKTVPLHNLRIVRGNTLYQGKAIYIVNTDIRELQFSSLKEIQRGDVLISNNDRLCFYDTINWKDLFLPAIDGMTLAHQVEYTNNKSPDRCPPCDPSCNGQCWAAGPEMCQIETQLVCSAICGYRCNGPRSEDCCHKECAAGCSGPTNSQCLACSRPFAFEDKCVDKCPKYQDGSKCVDECPENAFIEENLCVASCPDGKFPSNHINCEACEGDCPQICPGTDSFSPVQHVTALNIDSFQNCTEISGNIVITSSLFQGDSYYKIPKLEDLSKLEYFSNIWRISGYLQLQVLDPRVRDLSFFRSLRVISGRDNFYGYTLDISQTSAEWLGLVSLEEITTGSIVLAGNNFMCYSSEAFLWQAIVKAQGSQISISGSKEPDDCISERRICHSECAPPECWGPSEIRCFRCVNNKMGDKCVESCDIMKGQYYYSSPNKDCVLCDDECEANCTSGGPDGCVACRRVKDGRYCRQKCPLDKYTDPDNNCQACHPNCVDGCTGPANIIGEGGCNKCHRFLLDLKGNIVECLPRKLNDSCAPLGFPGAQTFGWTQEKNYSQTLDRCVESCVNKTDRPSIKGDECDSACPGNTYPDEVGVKLCAVCRSGNGEGCLNCRNVKQSDGRCAAVCEAGYQPEGDPACWPFNPNAREGATSLSDGKIVIIRTSSALLAFVQFYLFMGV